MSRFITLVSLSTISIVPYLGYAQCEILTGPDFQSVFNRHLWAMNAKLTSYYMIYGGQSSLVVNDELKLKLNKGTSWGGIPFP